MERTGGDPGKTDGRDRTGEAFEKLAALMSRLRQDCPWDRKQTFSDLSPYLLEESHEVLAALAGGNLSELEGELGDLLFQIVFLCQIGSESGSFDLASVARRVHDKMVARHPHVFGGEVLNDVSDPDGVRKQWEELKQKERKKRGDTAPSPFEGLPKTLPALLTASRMTARAADLGFDWRRDEDVLAKLEEEIDEFRAEIHHPAPSRERIASEVGDLLFTVVNIARRHDVDPEAALTMTNSKFRRRFEEVARRVTAGGRSLKELSLEELDAIWDQIKAEERG
ncbi:MAG: nucleoside triphosphate pyrophosphohydrolase [Acidobacteria bacterium]|nr:nucleoside triphosphate pyrophosphohydrolase [Acidobacteriota bacterium]MCK6683957.1 nucleoside triphosphate pyrophosphohydrolase [Thermoanaerobaculia bacterium]